LKYIENLYPVKLIEIIYEPLQEYHVDYEPLQEYHVDGYVNAMFYSGCSELVPKIRKRIDRYTGRYGKRREMVMSKRDSLIGHTVMSVFEKLS
jgi:hypothetical protein